MECRDASNSRQLVISRLFSTHTGTDLVPTPRLRPLTELSCRPPVRVPTTSTSHAQLHDNLMPVVEYGDTPVGQDWGRLFRKYDGGDWIVELDSSLDEESYLVIKLSREPSFAARLDLPASDGAGRELSCERTLSECLNY